MHHNVYYVAFGKGKNIMKINSLEEQRFGNLKYYCEVLKKFSRSLRTKLGGFTLAEVMIVVVIIGVVAALTIPSLIQDYKKSVVASKLKRTSSLLMQAYNLSIAHGDGATRREGFTPNNPDAALEMFNKYYVPYIKFLKVKKGQKGVFGYMPDGSVIYFRKVATPESWSDTYIIVCIDNKACENMSESDMYDIDKSINGKNTFGFYTEGFVPGYTFHVYTREQRINKCKNGRWGEKLEACTGLIFEAGWKVPDDYPIRL